MWACVVPGRPVLTTFATETYANGTSGMVFVLPSAQTIQHLCVVATQPSESLVPPGYSVKVLFKWPDRDPKVLGALSNEKPFAIFRFNNPTSASASSSSTSPIPEVSMDGTTNVFPSPSSSEDVTAHLCVLYEPDGGVGGNELILRRNTSTTTSTTGTGATTTSLIQVAIDLAPKIAKNLFNFLASFSSSSPGSTPGGPSGFGSPGAGMTGPGGPGGATVRGQWVEISAVEKWFRGFEMKVRNSAGTGRGLDWLENGQ